MVQFSSAQAWHSGSNLSNQIQHHCHIGWLYSLPFDNFEIDLLRVAKQFTKRIYSGFWFLLHVSKDCLAPDFFLIDILQRSSATSIIVSNSPERSLDRSSSFWRSLIFAWSCSIVSLSVDTDWTSVIVQSLLRQIELNTCIQRHLPLYDFSNIGLFYKSHWYNIGGKLKSGYISSVNSSPKRLIQSAIALLQHIIDPTSRFFTGSSIQNLQNNFGFEVNWDSPICFFHSPSFCWLFNSKNSPLFSGRDTMKTGRQLNRYPNNPILSIPIIKPRVHHIVIDRSEAIIQA